MHIHGIYELKFEQYISLWYQHQGLRQAANTFSILNYNILSRDFNYLPGGHLEVKLIVWVLWISLTSLLDVRQVSMQGQKVREEEAHGGDDALVPQLDGILYYVLFWLLYQNRVLFYSPVILKQKNILITSKQVEFIAHNNLFL